MTSDTTSCQIPASGAAEDQLLVHVLAKMAKGLLDQSKDTPAAVVEAGAGVSGGQLVTNHQEHGTPRTAAAQTTSKLLVEQGHDAGARTMNSRESEVQDE